MADEFVRAHVGHRVTLTLVNEAGSWTGTILDVGEQWIKVLVGKGKNMLIPISNVRSISIDPDS